MSSFIGYQRVAAVPGGPLTAAALTIPQAVARVQLQADTGNIRYTLSGAPPAPTALVGMLLVADALPIWVEREDLANIQFISVAGVVGLSLHYYGTTL